MLMPVQSNFCIASASLAAATSCRSKCIQTREGLQVRSCSIQLHHGNADVVEVLSWSHRPSMPTLTSWPLSASSLQIFHMMKTWEGAPHNGTATILSAAVPAAQARTMTPNTALMCFLHRGQIMSVHLHIFGNMCSWKKPCWTFLTVSLLSSTVQDPRNGRDTNQAARQQYLIHLQIEYTGFHKSH